MTEIARLRIELAEVERRVVRLIEVPLDIRLDNLHLVIQTAMPWQNCHLYAFHGGEGPGWGIPDPEFGATDPMFRSATKAALADLLDGAGGEAFTYNYDFGDDWLHVIELENMVAAEPGARYPRLIEAEGTSPPEDYGGPYGCAELLKAIAGTTKNSRRMDGSGTRRATTRGRGDGAPNAPTK